MRPLPAPQVTHISRITNDGLEKEFFVTDGTRLYYAAGSQSHNIRMFEVSTRGGDPVLMPQLTGMVPLDLSADGSELLLGQYVKDGSDDNFLIYVAGSMGGTPRRLGDLVADDARWSPQGDRIVYTANAQVRIARSDGSDPRILVTNRGGGTRYPAWSSDGRLIRFTAEAKDGQDLEEVAADGAHWRTLFPAGENQLRQEGTWTPDGKYFVFSVQGPTDDLWALRESSFLSFQSAPILFRLTNGPLLADRPRVSRDGHRIYFRGRLDKAELVHYDRKADLWEPYLGGLAGTQLDYSRDGKWIVYVSYPDNTVWRCAANGTERLQLTTPPLSAANPYWSPDGTQILFYGGPPGKPTRLYIVPAGGGAVREVTRGETGAGGDESGTWSHDGTKIVFAPKGSAQLASLPQGLPISLVDLKTGQVTPLPNSEKLWSPRWSPDGRYIAALGTPQSDLWLYDLAAHQKRQLTKSGTGWPSWSRDSQYVYFGFGTMRGRVRISDGKIDPPVNAHGPNVTLVGYGWTSLAPDGSLIATRNAGSIEIYALEWETP